MSTEPPASSSSPGPITSIDDPRAITLLTTEHWSLLSARSLAYNEAFARAGMFLTFLSMSFVALALLAQAMAFGRDFLSVAAIVLASDLVIGITTFLRISGANFDDLRAVHGMARIRHGYAQAAPLVARYFTTPMHDDIDAVTTVYGPISARLPGQIAYGLSTSLGMIALIVAMVGGVLAAVLVLLVGVGGGAALWIGLLGGLLLLAGMVAYSVWALPRAQARVTARFPTPAPEAPPASEAD